MKRDNETQTAYAIRLIREDERRECLRLAIWAVHDCGLPPCQDNLILRSLIRNAIVDVLKVDEG
jgi:hypothetical protein